MKEAMDYNTLHLDLGVIEFTDGFALIAIYVLTWIALKAIDLIWSWVLEFKPFKKNHENNT